MRRPCSVMLKVWMRYESPIVNVEIALGLLMVVVIAFELA